MFIFIHFIFVLGFIILIFAGGLIWLDFILFIIGNDEKQPAQQAESSIKKLVNLWKLMINQIEIYSAAIIYLESLSNLKRKDKRQFIQDFRNNSDINIL